MLLMFLSCPTWAQSYGNKNIVLYCIVLYCIVLYCISYDMTVYTILTTHVFKASEWDRTTDKGFFLRKGQKIGKKGNTRYHTRR